MKGLYSKMCKRLCSDQHTECVWLLLFSEQSSEITCEYDPPILQFCIPVNDFIPLQSGKQDLKQVITKEDTSMNTFICYIFI